MKIELRPFYHCVCTCTWKIRFFDHKVKSIFGCHSLFNFIIIIQIHQNHLCFSDGFFSIILNVLKQSTLPTISLKNIFFNTFSACEAYSYGFNCSGKCGKCNSGQVCNAITGKCSGGCQTGYSGVRCDQGKGGDRDASERHALIYGYNAIKHPLNQSTTCRAVAHSFIKLILATDCFSYFSYVCFTSYDVIFFFKSTYSDIGFFFKNSRMPSSDIRDSLFHGVWKMWEWVNLWPRYGSMHIRMWARLDRRKMWPTCVVFRFSSCVLEEFRQFAEW